MELAEKRVSRALKQIRLIGNLANKGNYNYSESDVQKIFSALNGELKAARNRFEEETRNDGQEFKL